MIIPKNPELAEDAAIDKNAGRRRLNVAERERQLIDKAIMFFSQHGLNGQLRDLAKSIGVAHTLLYHYFPTKQALLDRICDELFEDRWRPEWEALLDDPDVDIEEKLIRFYGGYVTDVLSKEFVRILIYSGLTDHSITDRFFAMLRVRLFPRLVRETRRFRGASLESPPTERELELLIGLHGGIFYMTMRRWVYGQDVYRATSYECFRQIRFDDYVATLIHDRVRAYLISSRELFGQADVQALGKQSVSRKSAPGKPASSKPALKKPASSKPRPRA